MKMSLIHLFMSLKSNFFTLTFSMLQARNRNLFFADDLEPAADNADYEIQKRCNSALRIRVYDCQLL